MSYVSHLILLFLRCLEKKCEGDKDRGSQIDTFDGLVRPERRHPSPSVQLLLLRKVECLVPAFSS
jgi:hypothetical protein